MWPWQQGRERLCCRLGRRQTELTRYKRTSIDSTEVICYCNTDGCSYVQRHCHVAVPEEEYLCSTTKCVHRRTRRKAREVRELHYFHSTVACTCLSSAFLHSPSSSYPQQPSHTPKFDSYSNDRWLRRHLVLQRFVQAGRRVIVQLRCQRRLERIKKVGADLQAGKTLEEALGTYT